jgi:hypothetical protein
MALEFQKVVEQAYCELIVAHREHSEVARSVAELGVSGPTPRETLHEVARFAVRCHPVRGFDGGRGEGRPTWVIRPVRQVLETMI